MQAIVVIATSSVLAMLIPLIGYIGAAAIALVVLHAGIRQGLELTGIGMLAAGLLAWIVAGGQAVQLVLMMAIQWMPVLLIAWALRVFRSQGLAFSVAGGLGVLSVLLIHLLTGSPREWWRSLLEQFVQVAKQQQNVQVDPQVLDNLAGIMTGLAVAGSVIGVIIAVLLARWWQAMLYNPGGFAQEFRQFRVSRTVAPAALVLGALALMLSGQWRELVLDILMVGLVVYLVQGISLFHALVAWRGLSPGWLVLLYGMILFGAPYGILMIGMAGYADTWIDIRSRISGSAA